jgi:putative phosphoesterase
MPSFHHATARYGGLIRLGLISDTHGLLRPKVHTVFQGVDVILHAGDVCGDDILAELRTIAPVHAVAGNCDPPGDPNLPLSFEQTFESVRLHMSHGHELGRPKPEELLKQYPDADVIVYGHTHHQMLLNGAGRIVVNPGAAGARRFNLPPSVAVMQIDEDRVSVEIVALE